MYLSGRRKGRTCLLTQGLNEGFSGSLGARNLFASKTRSVSYAFYPLDEDCEWRA
jgi:hypothetical protein